MEWPCFFHSSLNEPLRHQILLTTFTMSDFAGDFWWGPPLDCLGRVTVQALLGTQNENSSVGLLSAVVILPVIFLGRSQEHSLH